MPKAKESNAKKVSPATLEKYLKGIKFPINKKGLINQAKQNNAPQEITDVLNQLENYDYKNVTDISKEMSKIAA